jgi:hypothetical protein
VFLVGQEPLEFTRLFNEIKDDSDQGFGIKDLGSKNRYQ